MGKNQSVRASARRLALVCILVAAASTAASAQSFPAAQPSPSPQASPTPQAKSSQITTARHLVRNIFRDQRAIWTSPFHMDGDDAKWLAPLGLSSALLFATDRHTAGELFENGDNATRLRISRDISYGGSAYVTGSIAAAFYLVGRAGHSARARETGLLGAEALLDSGIITGVLKNVSQRQRPTTDHASGEFFAGGMSFPSGHSASAWSLATVIAEEYGHHRPLVRFGMYGLAAAVSVSRYTGRNHFLSDVLVGGAIGYGIGHYVYRTHHDPNLDGEEQSGSARSKWFPAIAPRFNAGTKREREYGAALAWNF